LSMSKKAIKNSVVPDVTGMGLRDAIYVLENLGMNVDIHGYGKVTRQSIKPGQEIKDEQIDIYLN
jgi:cell division protein FtsI (penicillin-binding protein 3)